MKLRFTVGGLAEHDLDVQVTADVTATVGQIAQSIVLSAPVDSRWRETAAEGAPLTLRVRYPGERQTYLLDTSSALHASGLRSGCWLEALPVGRRDVQDLYADAEPVAYLRCVAGPYTGIDFPLFAGSNVVGRGRHCRVLLDDDLVSRAHARIEVDGHQATVHDLASANGTSVDGVRVSRATLGPASEIELGSTRCVVVPVPGAAPGGEGLEHPTSLVHVRSPRVESRFARRKVEIPAPPALAQPQRAPVIALVAPLVMGAVMYAVTRNMLSIVFVAMSPLIMISTYVDSIFSTRRRRRADAVRFDATMTRLEERLRVERLEEVAVREHESPTTDDVVRAMREQSPLLWTRRPEHQGFVELRLGSGTQRSRIAIDLPSRPDCDEAMWERVESLEAACRTVRPVPVLERLDRAGNLGVVGASGAAHEAMASVVTQLVGLHAPGDLVLTCFADEAQVAGWSWLKWLPHVGAVASPVATDHLVCDAQRATRLLAQLEEVVLERSGAVRRSVRSHLGEDRSIDELHGEAVAELPVTPTVVVVVLSDRLVDRARLVALAEDGPDVGVHLLWLASSAAVLPAACRTYVETGPAPAVGFVRTGQLVDLDQVELLNLRTAADAAMRLAAVVDAGARDVDESDLPSAVSYQDLRDDDVTTSPQTVVQAWRAGTDGRLAAVVGQGTGGTMALSLREHGPHALVGGTTGAGKSEFLQTWIMSMAAEHSPERVTFLLVDYKGGAAFAECTQLPHTVGLVTDLSPRLVRRALTSLRAELHFRERLLNDKGAKDLVSLERRGDPDCPPALVIVVDEFAALVSDVPEFVDGVVDIAARGRSLGLHLVLATQRPAGVIKDNLRANTNLRVALRMADEADSMDVVGRKDAAAFDPSVPGRAVAKLGPGALQHFQTAYLGGHTSAAISMPDIAVAPVPFSLERAWSAPRREGGDEAPGPRDIERMLTTIRQAATDLTLDPPRRPWLDVLEAVVDLREVPGAPDDGTGALALGLRDEPEHQRRSSFVFRPEVDGNLAVLGTGGTGKSGFLRTVALAASAGVEPVEIYAIDAAGGALGMLESLPTVGSVVRGDDTERVQRLVRRLTALVTERETTFSARRAATLSEYRTLVGDRSVPRVVLLVDGISALRELHEFAHSDPVLPALGQLLTAGRQVGVHVVLTADRPGAIPTAMSSSIGQRVVLRLASSSDYNVAGVPTDVLVDAVPGRAYVEAHEVQVAVWGGSANLDEQAAAAEELAAELRAAGVRPVPEVERLAEEIALGVLPDAVGGRPVVGVGDRDLAPATIPADGLLVVTGPFGSGRTTAVRTLVAAVARARGPVRAVLLSARVSSELQAAPSGVTWTEVGLGADDAGEVAAGVLRALGAPASPVPAMAFGGPLFGPDVAPPGAPAAEPGGIAGGGSSAAGTALPDLVVIEASGEFEGAAAESTIAALIKAVRRAGLTTIVETEVATGAAAWQIHSELKSARAGIVLQPEEGDGIALFRTNFPRGTRADFPVGRGYLVEQGRATKVQIAVAE